MGARGSRRGPRPSVSGATLRGCEGRVVCWKRLLLVERRTHNPTPIHPSCGSVKSDCLLVELRAEAESKKDPLIGGP